MKTRLKFSNEPVAYIGLVILILQILQAIYKGEPLEGFADSILTVGGTIVTRQLVTPVVGRGVVIYRNAKHAKIKENSDA